MVILSVRDKNTDRIRKKLKGETKKRVLVQDYLPEKHSLYNYIEKSTKMKS